MEDMQCLKATDWQTDLVTLTLSVLLWAFIDGTTSIYFKKIAIKYYPSQEPSKNTQTEPQTTPNPSLHPEGGAGGVVPPPTDQDIRQRLPTTSSDNGYTTSSSTKQGPTTTSLTPVPMTNFQRKVQRSLWKALNYMLLFILGSISLYFFGDDWAFRVDKYFVGWPQPIPVFFHIYYMLEMAHYIYTSLIIPWEPKQSDRLQMLSHHVITLVLLTGSYCYLYWRVGVTLLWLTDMSDPILEIAKLFKYANKPQAADCFFTLFAVVFLLSRIIIFPYLIGYPSLLGAWDLPYGQILNYFLWGLVAIFYFWAFIILRIGYRLLMGVSASDTRDEDD